MHTYIRLLITIKIEHALINAHITRLNLHIKKFKFLTAYLNSMQPAENPPTCNSSNAPTPQTKQLTVEPAANTSQNINESFPLTSIQNRNKKTLSQAQKHRSTVNIGNTTENNQSISYEKSILDACDSINLILQNNHYARIQMAIYPQFCRMLNIDQLKDTITKLIEDAHIPNKAKPSDDSIEKKLKENEQIIERLESKVLHLERNSMNGTDAGKTSLSLEKVQPVKHVSVISKSITEQSSPITFPNLRSDYVCA